MNLNVFNRHNFYSWHYPKYWGKNMRIFFRQFKWAYQRITKGYCDCDWYDLDTYLAQLMADTIDDLAEYGIGYPGTGEFDTPEKWKAYLKKIVLKLRYSLSELPNEYEEVWLAIFHGDDLWRINEKHILTPEEEEIRRKHSEKTIENEQKQFQAQLNALDMIKHVWGSLWD